VNIKTNDFLGIFCKIILRLLLHLAIRYTRPKRRCTPICDAALLLRCNWCRYLAAVKLHTALNSLHPIHAAYGHYTRNSTCMTLLWLHHSHKMSISYHKNGLVGIRQSAGRWFIFCVLCSKNILMKLVGYQQPTCLCANMEFVVGTISLWCELHSLSCSCFRSCGVSTIV